MVFNEYFGLRENPFAITPDPRYLFLSQRHQEALAHLLYGVQEGGGFVQLTGEVGTGKTTLIRALLEQLPDNVDVAFIFNPRLTAREFLASLCDELKVDYPRETDSVKSIIDALNDYLLDAYARGRRVVLIIDEAQNFHSDVLEQIRLLTNLETTRQKLLQIILVGQPELRELLARRELRQLAQRITARYHLAPMTRVEVQAYVAHRVSVAGGQRALFTAGALGQVWKFSSGVPRLVNILCERSLLGAYASEAPRVTAGIMRRAVAEIKGSAPATPVARSLVVAAASSAVMTAGAVLLWQSGIGQRWWHETFQQAKSQETRSQVAESGALSRTDFGSVAAAASPTPVIVANTVPSVGTAPTALANPLGSIAELREALATTAGTDDLDRAFSSLFAAWRVDYWQLVGVSGCERALGARLRCYWANGTLTEFEQLNFPAILWESAEHAEGAPGERYLTVLGIRDGRVYIDLAGQRAVVGRELLETFWNGRYLAVWRPPSLDVQVLRPGMRGDLVVWLRRTLDRIDGKLAESSEPEVYDQGLMQRVRAFQQSRGLQPDGLVGERTLIHLNAVDVSQRLPLLSSFDPNSTS